MPSVPSQSAQCCSEGDTDPGGDSGGGHGMGEWVPSWGTADRGHTGDPRRGGEGTSEQGTHPELSPRSQERDPGQEGRRAPGHREPPPAPTRPLGEGTLGDPGQGQRGQRQRGRGGARGAAGAAAAEAVQGVGVEIADVHPGGETEHGVSAEPKAPLSDPRVPRTPLTCGRGAGPAAGGNRPWRSPPGWRGGWPRSGLCRCRCARP